MLGQKRGMCKLELIGRDLLEGTSYKGADTLGTKVKGLFQFYFQSKSRMDVLSVQGADVHLRTAH